MTSTEPKPCSSRLEITLFLLVGCMGYVNSAINPILYAYLSDNFKKSFMKACTCATSKEINAQLRLENSVMPRKSRNRANSETPVTMTTTTVTTKGNRLLLEPVNFNTTTTTGLSDVSSRNPSPAVQRQNHFRQGDDDKGAYNNNEIQSGDLVRIDSC